MTTEELENRRMLAANMFDENLPPATVARILNVDDQTARQWRRVYRDKGREGLRGNKPPGAPPKLTEEQKHQLVDLLAKPPQEYGLEGWLWSSKLIAVLILQKFKVEYHHDHVSAILRDLGMSWQRPMHRAQERDEQAIEGWRNAEWPALLKKVVKPEAPLSLPTKSDS